MMQKRCASAFVSPTNRETKVIRVVNVKFLLVIILLIFVSGCVSDKMNQKNEIKLDDVTIRWLGHASFEIKGNKTIYIDPFALPENPQKADYILITHSHYDHCAVDNVKKIQTSDTRIIAPLDCVRNLTGKTNSVKAGESFGYPDGIKVEAVPAYNINKSYHPKGFGIGFVITIDGKKIYHAGDTDFIPEMSQLSRQNIDAALLPVGGTYTMTAEEAAKAAKAIKPKIAVPMHFGSIVGSRSDAERFASLLKGSGVEAVILKSE